MTQCIIVPSIEANAAKKYLIEHDWLDSNYSIGRNEDRTEIVFPVTPEYSGHYQVQMLDMHKKKNKNSISLRNFIEKNYPHIPFDQCIRSYDLVGNIAILEIPEPLESMETAIAEHLLQDKSTIRTVLKKSEAHEGVFRTQKMIHLGGEPSTVANFIESGCRFTIDVENVYFSIRQSTERLRVARLVRPDERILVMFCGAAPYPCVLAKHSAAKHIHGIELNPDGHKYGLVNVKQNKVGDRVALYQGDVREVAPKLGTYDRIIMPLPKTSLDFLDVALGCARKGTVLNIYFFSVEQSVDDIPPFHHIFTKFGRVYEIQSITKNGQASAGIYRLCYDVLVTN